MENTITEKIDFLMSKCCVLKEMSENCEFGFMRAIILERIERMGDKISKTIEEVSAIINSKDEDCWVNTDQIVS